ncbi:MAG: hypothetical protein WB559_16150 [Candidatus Acidiferrales bacterium]
MKATHRVSRAAFVVALFLTLSIAAPTALAKYDSYHSALGQLRAARAYIEHPDSGQLHDQEKNALAEIDAAIAEVKSVADDGKSLDNHPSIDSNARWIAKLNKAVEQLNKAHDNVAKEDDTSGARERAVDHIGKARKFVIQAIALEQ